MVAAAKACHELLGLLALALECMWAQVVAAGREVGNAEGALDRAQRVREECDLFVAAGEQLLASASLRAVFESALSSERALGGIGGWGGGDDGDDRARCGGTQMEVAVAHGMSRCIALLLSRPWPVAAYGSAGRSVGPQLSLADAARPWNEALVGAVSLHVAVLLQEQRCVVKAAADGESRGKKKARESDSKSGAEKPKSHRIRRRPSGVDVTLAVLSALHEHLDVEKARAIVVAVLELDLECKHTQQLTDGFGEVAAIMIRSLSLRVSRLQIARGFHSCRRRRCCCRRRRGRCCCLRHWESAMICASSSEIDNDHCTARRLAPWMLWKGAA